MKCCGRHMFWLGQVKPCEVASKPTTMEFNEDLLSCEFKPPFDYFNLNTPIPQHQGNRKLSNATRVAYCIARRCLTHSLCTLAIFVTFSQDQNFWGGPESNCLFPYPLDPDIFLKKTTRTTDITRF